MSFPGLKNYLARLYGTTRADTRVWRGADGRAKGRYFNSTLTSAFQPVRDLATGQIVAHEGFARTSSGTDQGLCLWKLLDHAANDAESVELDRLCRVLHAVNFFRQPQAEGSDLYLSVHARLLAAVDGNHGTAFRQILSLLDLPQQRIVLQLPAIAQQRRWLLDHVADNYRRNDFRIAVNAVDAQDGLSLIDRVRPQVVKLDTRNGVCEESALKLIRQCAERHIRIVFKRVEGADMLDILMRMARSSGMPVHAQGFIWDLPHASIKPAESLVKLSSAPHCFAPCAGPV